MLNAFRKFTKSRYGLIAVFLFLGLLAIAFAASDVTGLRSMNLGGGSPVLARVNGRDVTEKDVRERLDRLIRNAQEQGQNVTMAQALAQGAFEAAVDDAINSAAMITYGNRNSMRVGKLLIDTDIANNPQFAGIDGKFSQQTFEQLLAQNRISPAQYREAITNQRYASWLLGPATMRIPAPEGVALPYASMLLERRTGIVGFVQSAAMDPGAAPDAKTLADYYQRNRNRYMVPALRVVRYALATPDLLKAQATASDAEIAKAYQTNAARYAASEKRSVELVTALDRGTAQKVAEAAKSGDLAAAAKAAGLEMRKVDSVDRAGLAKQVSQAFADAAFGAGANTLTGPSQLGGTWYVFRVAKVEKIAARSLDQVRGEIAQELTQRKLSGLLGDLRQSIDDGIGGGKNFDEAVRDAKLTAQRTPALTATGTDPLNPDYKPTPAISAVMKTGFGFDQPGDEPQIVPAGADGSFAVVSLERILPAAPRPLAQITDKVKADYLLDQALAKARAAANVVMAKVQKGVPMQQALTEAGVTKGAPPKPFDFKRSELRDKETFIQAAFDMKMKTARVVEAPARAGYYVVFVDTIQPGSAAGDAVSMQPVRSGLTQMGAGEYAREFSTAMRKQLKVTRNETAIARLRAELLRSGAGDQ